MKYQINKDNYCNFKTISVNRLDRRSYFIPYPDNSSVHMFHNTRTGIIPKQEQKD